MNPQLIAQLQLPRPGAEIVGRAVWPLDPARSITLCAKRAECLQNWGPILISPPRGLQSRCFSWPPGPATLSGDPGQRFHAKQSS